VGRFKQNPSVRLRLKHGGARDDRRYHGRDSFKLQLERGSTNPSICTKLLAIII
jgi:hypothetical protein